MDNLPPVTAEEEAGFVHGADLGKDHPDNVPLDSDGVDVDAVLPQTTAENDEDLPSEDELDDLVAGVDSDDVDNVGFDDADLEEPLGIADRLGDQPQAGGS
jgi:hypothetical protein